MKILVVNAGSSSLKYQLFDMETGEVLAKGLCERIGIDGAVTHKRPGKSDYKASAPLADHKAAIELVLSLLTDAELGVITDVSEIGAVGHRFAHGGEKLRESSVLGEDELEYLESIVFAGVQKTIHNNRRFVSNLSDKARQKSYICI